MSFTKPQVSTAAKQSRGLSSDLWCPKGGLAGLSDYRNGNLDIGWGFFDDFVDKNDISNYTATAATSGTFLQIDKIGGVVEADAAAATDDQGINVQRASTVGECFKPAAGTHIFFETRVLIKDIGVGTGDLFFGLSVIDTTIIDNNANSSANHIGFEHVTKTDMLMDFHSEKGGVRGSSADVFTMVDGDVTDTGWVKIGFWVDGVTKVTPYVNGIAKTAITSGSTTTPVTEMTPSIVVKATGETDVLVWIDWVACFQLQDFLHQSAI